MFVSCLVLQSFSNFQVCTFHLGILQQRRVYSVGLGWGRGFFTSNHLLGDAVAASSRTTLSEAQSSYL